MHLRLIKTMKKEKLTYEPNDSQSRASLLALRYQYLNDPDVDCREPYEVWLDFRMDLLTLWEEEHGTLKCVYCGQDNLEKVTEGIRPQYQATLDHVKPLSKGGAEYDESNLVCACLRCNQKKANMTLEQFNNMK